MLSRKQHSRSRNNLPARTRFLFCSIEAVVVFGTPALFQKFVLGGGEGVVLQYYFAMGCDEM